MRQAYTKIFFSNAHFQIWGEKRRYAKAQQALKLAFRSLTAKTAMCHKYYE